MKNLKSLRDAFGKALVELGDKNENVVVLDADVSHPTRTSYFEEKYPERFFEMGVAEQNLMGIAAGLATIDLVPFAITFAVFASKKACDQVSISIAYPRLNVKVVGTYAGLTTPNTGATHQSVEDIAIMRAMPNMIVVVPADAIELRQAVKTISKHDGPVYLRVARSEVPTIFEDGYQFQLGKAITLKEGNDVTLIGTGVMTAKCLEASKILAQEKIDARVINIHTIKPIDEKAIIKAAKETGAVVTAENHSIIGGLGSAVSEVLTDNFPVFLKRVGMKDSFGSSGKLDDLFEKYSLTPIDIAGAAKEVIKKKRKRGNIGGFKAKMRQYFSSEVWSEERKKELRSTSRQRILTTLSHKQPDRCVTYIWADSAVMERLMKYLKVNTPEEVENELGIDKWRGVQVEISMPDDYQQIINSLIPSEYKNNRAYCITCDGRVNKIHKTVNYLEDTVWYPLGNIDNPRDLDRYPFLQPSWVKVSDNLKNRIGEYKEKGFVVSGEITQPFKSAWLLRGMKNVLMDYLVSPGLINTIYKRVYSFSTASCTALVKAGVDIISIIGDLAMQDGLIMSPAVWRQFDKKRLRVLISTLKRINPEVKIFMHTDGDVKEIIDDLIEVGIDILNPIQHECMNPTEIKKKYGDRLVLHGAVSLQKTLPFGSSEDVKEEVRYLIKNCNVNGGFVLGPSNVIFKEIPCDNIVAMYQAVY